MTDLDTNLINHHAHLARGFLANDPDVDHDAGYQAVQALADVDVPHLLLHIEEREVNADEAYVRGLRDAARWLSAFDQPLPDFDQATCRHLARGLTAMADSASKRLGVDVEGDFTPPDIKAAADALWAGVR